MIPSGLSILLWAQLYLPKKLLEEAGPGEDGFPRPKPAPSCLTHKIIVMSDDVFQP